MDTFNVEDKFKERIRGEKNWVATFLSAPNDLPYLGFLPTTPFPEGSREPPPVIVQFTAPIYFVEQREGQLTIDVMRLGSRGGAVAARWFTMEASAAAGVTYQQASGVVRFEEHESNKQITILLFINFN